MHVSKLIKVNVEVQEDYVVSAIYGQHDSSCEWFLIWLPLREASGVKYDVNFGNLLITSFWCAAFFLFSNPLDYNQSTYCI